MGAQLDSGHYVVGVVDILSERDEEHRARRLVQGIAGEFCVAHDTDDAERGGVLRQVQAEVLLQRVFAAFEKAFHEGFVDDGNWGGGFVVGGGEGAAAQNRNAKVLKIVGADAIPRRAGFIAH